MNDEVATLLRQIRDQGEESLRLQREHVELYRRNLERVERINDRSEAIQGRAEQLQARGARVLRVIALIAVPLAVLILVLMAWPHVARFFE